MSAPFDTLQLARGFEAAGFPLDQASKMAEAVALATKVPAWGTLSISVLTAVVAAVVTTWLALRRFRSERWWEKKFAVYTSIIEALQQMSSVLSEDIDNEQRASQIAIIDRSPESTQKYQAAHDEIWRAIGLGEFIISAEAVAELRRFRRESNKDYKYYSDYLDDSMKVTNDCLRNIRNIAREDLKGGIGSSYRQVGRILARTKRALLKK
jgi:hypothetical protein